MNEPNNLVYNSSFQKEEKKCFISIGRCSRLYLFILYSGGFKLFTILILGEQKNNNKGIGLFSFSPKMNNYNFYQGILTNLGYIIFGLIFYFWKGRINKKIQSENKNLNLLVAKPKSKDIIKKASKKTIFLVCITFVIYTESLNVLYINGFQFLDYWPTEILFILYLMKRYYKIDYYLHQKVSIIFIVTFCCTMLFIASFFSMPISTDKQINTYQNIENKFGNYLYCIPFIILFLLLNLIYSFSKTYSKILFEINFISPYILIICIGIIGLIATLSSSLISYIFNYYDNIINYFNDLGEVLDKNEKYMFYSEIFLVSPLFAFGKFMQLLFEMFLIYHLNPIFALLTNDLCYGITKLVTFIISGSDYVGHFIFSELTELLAVIGYLVYLEILELNFCGLSDNLRRKIMLKGENEFLELSAQKKRKESIDPGEGDDNSQEYIKNTKSLTDINSEFYI